MHRSEGSFGRPHPERRTRRRRFGFYFRVVYARCFHPVCLRVLADWGLSMWVGSPSLESRLPPPKSANRPRACVQFWHLPCAKADSFTPATLSVSELGSDYYFFFAISISHLPLWWYSLLLPQPLLFHVTPLLLLLPLPPPPRVCSHF